MTYLLDGGLNNNLLSNGVTFNPNPDAVQEFRILTSNYTAEYGRNGGGVISVVTRSGTNELHGSVFEFLRNEKLNANNFFNNRNGIDRPVLKRNQFGGSLGGPVVIPKLFDGRNKLFFFSAYQGFRQSDVQIGTGQPTFTQSELQGDFSRSNTTRTGPNADVVAFLRQFPYFQPNSALASQGIIDPSRINSVARKYIQAGWIPTSATGQIFPQGSRRDDRDESTNKIDFTPTDKDRIAVTLGYNTRNLLTPIGGSGITVTGWPVSTLQDQYFGNVTYTRIFTPALLNELRFTAQRAAQSQNVPAISRPKPADLGITINSDRPSGPPALFFDSGMGIGFNPNGPTDLINNTYALYDSATWTKGRHTLKGGFLVSSYQNNTVYDYYVNGAFSFGPSTDTTTGNDFADFLIGLPYNYFQSPSAPSNIRTKSWAGFVQDEWRVHRDLTLSLGLRYEYNEPKYDQQGRSFSLAYGQQSQRFVNAPRGLLFPGDPGAPKGSNFPDRNDWGPRFGFAWAPGGAKTSIRGGFGVFYDILKGEDNLQFNGQAPFFGYADLYPELPASNPTAELGYLANPYAALGVTNPFPSRPPAKDIDFVANGFAPIGGSSVYYVDRFLRTPYVMQWNLSIQREVARNLVAQVAYVASGSRKLTGLVDVNPMILGTNQRIFNLQLSNPNGADFSFLREFRNVGNASYNSLQASLEKRFSDVPFFGETYFTASYTWSHNIDTVSGFRNNTARVPYYNEKLFRASADYDVRHRAVFSGYWELPFGKLGGPRWLTRGWSLAPIFSYQTGFPIDIYAAITNTPTRPGPSGAGDAGLVRANLVGSTVTTYDPKQPSSFNNRTGNYWFDPANFTRAGLITSNAIPTAAQRTYGSLPRNFFRGPDFMNLDVTLSKEFRFTERVRLSLRGEFFNATNRVNFNSPNTTITSGNFGQITTTASPRIGQVATRLVF